MWQEEVSKRLRTLDLCRMIVQPRPPLSADRIENGLAPKLSLVQSRAHAETM